MAISKLKETVKKIADEKKIYWSSDHENVIWDAERKLDRGEIDISKAMEKLRTEFKDEFDKYEYEKIEKEMHYNLE